MQEVSGPLPNVEHVQPAPPLVVAHVTVRHSQSVPASGQSRSAQHTALDTVSPEHVVPFGAVVLPVLEGTVQRHDLPSLGVTHEVDVAGTSPGGPTAATFPHALSHCWRMHEARAALAGDVEVGYAMARHDALPACAHVSRSPTVPRQRPSPQHWSTSVRHDPAMQLPHVAFSPAK